MEESPFDECRFHFTRDHMATTEGSAMDFESVSGVGTERASEQKFRRVVYRFLEESGGDLCSMLPKMLPQLWKFALRISGDKHDAEDLLQLACLRALERAYQLQPDTAPLSWMFSIGYSTWINEVRARGARSRAGFEWDDDLPDSVADPAARTPEKNLTSGQIVSAVQRLPEPQRVAMLLVAIEGMSYKEAARSAGRAYRHDHEPSVARAANYWRSVRRRQRPFEPLKLSPPNRCPARSRSASDRSLVRRAEQLRHLADRPMRCRVAVQRNRLRSASLNSDCLREERLCDRRVATQANEIAILVAPHAEAKIDRLSRSEALPFPPSDPVLGDSGPLIDYWMRAD
jgi:RNA polymerase sigma-70 factor, ECF subfamily